MDKRRFENCGVWLIFKKARYGPNSNFVLVNQGFIS
jgi:hypothetical protein